MLFCSLYDGPLLSSFLNFRFSIIPRFPVTTCPAGWCVNFDWWQLQLRFFVPISKSSSWIVCLKLKILPPSAYIIIVVVERCHLKETG